MRIWRVFVTLIMLFAIVSVQAQTYYEPASGDVYTPSGLQKGVRTATDIGLIVLPVTAVTVVLIQKDWKGLVQGLEVAGATVATTFLLKGLVRERRPDGSDMHSFPSGHTSFSFASAAFLQRRYGWKFGAPAYAVAAFVGWGRVYSKRHHIWDVVAGGAIGAGFAYLFTTPFAKKHNLSVSPVSDGNSIGIYASMDF